MLFGGLGGFLGRSLGALSGLCLRRSVSYSSTGILHWQSVVEAVYERKLMYSGIKRAFGSLLVPEGSSGFMCGPVQLPASKSAAVSEASRAREQQHQGKHH
jgi:hypothetical protein